MNDTAVAEVVVGEIVPNQIAAYNPFRKKVEEMKAINANTVFDYEDPKGNTEARSYIYKLRQSKAALEKVRKEEKAASLDYGRKVDAEAKAITQEIEAMIDVHQKPLDEIERREKERVENIKNRIQSIIDCGNGLIGGEVQPYGLLIHELEEKIIIDDSYAEFADEAHKAKEEALIKLKKALEEDLKRRAEQEELERLREEKAQREREETEERLRREAEERVRREAEEEAERERKAAAEREKALIKEREDAERREKEAKERVEQEIKEAEERERQRIADEERRKREEEEKRIADEEHRAAIEEDIRVDIYKTTSLSSEQLDYLMQAIKDGVIRHLKITY